MSGTPVEVGTEALPKKGGRVAAAFALSVVDGPDKGLIGRIEASSKVLVGTSEACGIRLSDRSVSRRHLSLEVHDASLRVRDLDSTNGAFVQGVRVFEAALVGGEHLRVGSTSFLVEAVAPSDAGLSKLASFGRVLGASPSMRRIYPLVTQLAASSVPVLLEGEAGTGKELLAEAIHEQSERADKPFVVCDATDENVDALLFGTKAAPGLLEQAASGTLFIDEVAELSPTIQQKLVRFLENHGVLRSDGSHLEGVDVRVVAGSRKDVDQQVQQGKVKEELAAILCRARVELPPLREREGDVRTLAQYFWNALDVGDRFIAPVTMRRFESYGWPGNVRELQGAIVRLATTGEDAVDPGHTLRTDDKATLGEIAERLLLADLPLLQARGLLGEEFDRRYLVRILARHGGNVSRAAAASGIARRYFQSLKTKHGIPAKG